MAKRKAAKNAKATGTQTAQNVEPAVIKLAEQLGAFLGRLQKKADGWRGNATMRRQATQIRDGAADLLEQVSKAGASAKRSITKATAPTKKAKAKSVKARSGGSVEAPGKRHRKPPPQELFDSRLGEPMGKQMGQKNLNRRRGRE